MNDDEEDTAHPTVSEAHLMYLKYHRHHQSDMSQAVSRDHKEVPDFPMFHRVAKTGVIYATSRAQAQGFSPNDESWANMGQGAPETGPLEGAPTRSFTQTLSIPDAELEYAPCTGLKELRVKVADYYNHLYREGKESQYTYENICIVPGGRAGITRIMSVLGTVQVGYFSPDYTAYEQALGLYLRVSPSPLLHRDVNEALMPPKEFEFQVSGRGIGAVLLSNPCNPTGQSIEGEDLKEYVRIARESGTSIIMDEFYSHYYYDGPEEESDDVWPKTVSSSRYIKDVDADPILIVNGLTKNWRCPGFRICWIVAPKAIVEMLGSAGSFLDGGANAPLQRLSLPLMDLEFIRKDAWALQRHFKKKRDYLLTELKRLGIVIKWVPTSTFYIWACLSKLPPPLNDCLVFLEECTKHKLVCVPGVFFDVNPRGIRNLAQSKCITNVRFSYGPAMKNLTKGVAAIEKMIEEWKKKPCRASVYEKHTVSDSS